MRRCHDGGLSEFHNERWLQLEALGVDENPVSRCTKYLLVSLDPDEILRIRAKQKIHLARYARQSILQWDAVSVPEFLQYYELLVETIEAENKHSNGEEDYG